MLNVMRSRATSFFIILICIFALFNGRTVSAETIQGTPDDTSGIFIYTAAGEESAPNVCDGTPAELPTADIIRDALDFNILAFIGDSPEEILDFTTGGEEETLISGQVDTTRAEIITGLTAIDNFGHIISGGDDDANFGTGTGGQFHGGFRDPYLVIAADGIVADGTLGAPSSATSTLEANLNLGGMEIFIFEDSELSGFQLELFSPLNTFVVNFDDLQVNPGARSGADDILIGIDLDSLPNWDNTYITDMRLTDDGIQQATVDSCTGADATDQSLEIDAIVARKVIFSNVSTGSIAGTVTEDINYDGIGDIPIAGVTISLLNQTGNPVLDAYGIPLITTTDAQGSYIFPNLPPDTYTVVETQPDNYADVSQANSSIPNHIIVTVEPGEENSDNDFVELFITTTAISLTGQTTDSVTLSGWLIALAILMIISTAQLVYKDGF